MTEILEIICLLSLDLTRIKTAQKQYQIKALDRISFKITAS